MNLRTHIQPQNSARPRRPGCNERAIALVITLLMLSVITFLAVAFLAMTDRDKNAVTTTLDTDTAKSMSDAALARAQAQIVAQMMANNDVLSYDYMASHNYVNSAGFTNEGIYDPANVNYDTLITNGGSANASWAANIANLYWDPRPPVFVLTNGLTGATDFRFWVDVNRNGRFETNGLVQDVLPNGNPNPGIADLVNGEPEWIGVLKYPEYAHSPTNPFVGRYAFMALPIGKTLDLNFIHNYSKFAVGTVSGGGYTAMRQDAFIRDEGAGSWELNLAALLNDISPAMYQTNPLVGPYVYSPGSGANTGGAFDDASQILGFRYGYNPTTFPETLFTAFGSPLPNNLINNIDEYAANPSLVAPFDYTGLPLSLNKPWAGGYNSNMFYDPQDLFDPNKTGITNMTPSGLNFATRLSAAVALLDTTNRYTFQRLLASIGTSSSPEYGVYVYSNLFITSSNTITTVVPPPSVLRTKVNINYDNTAQIQAGPYTPYGAFTPMPTNLLLWTNNALGFFTNAADLLLRSQVFVYTNYVTNFAGFAGVFYPSNYIMGTFGITNIPVYVATNPGITYNEQIHRMVQLAANIYAAANPIYISGVQQPPVFRPQFQVTQSGGSNATITITNFVQVTNDAYNQIINPSGFASGFKDMTNTTILPNDNVWGVPWIVGAVKGNPEFNQYSYQYRVFYQRFMKFYRKGDPNHPGQYLVSLPLACTNEYYEMSVSNTCGMDAWNPYTNTFLPASGSLYVMASNYVSVIITNNYQFGIIINYTNVTNGFIGSSWPGTTTGSPFQVFLQTNFTVLPYSYFSEFDSSTRPYGAFVTLTNSSQSYLSGDTNQSIYPNHYWTVSVTNHLYYALFDGNPSSGNASLLDFVNVGPFGASFPISQFLQTNTSEPFNYLPYPGSSSLAQPPSAGTSWWWIPNATDVGSAALPDGALNQIRFSTTGNMQFYDDITGHTGGSSAAYRTFTFPPPAGAPTNVVGPYALYVISNGFSASDPLVHYTLGDLTWPGSPQGQWIPENVLTPSDNQQQPTPWKTTYGSESMRYQIAIQNTNIVFGDTGMASADNWQFPANLFPGVGWLGRVHRGTPWQTVYLKPDDPNNITTSYQNWFTTWVNSPFTYPTNDWSLIDLFTAVPNDNAARGLLSVNQTNSAAWAAVFAGVIAMTNTTGGTPVLPSIDPTLGYGNNVYSLMDYTNGTAVGINQARMNANYHPNGLFHRVGEILQASTLTVNSPFVGGLPNTLPEFQSLSDEMVERIPQQTLSLLKVGLPQFVIYSWGQALKPQSVYTGGPVNLTGIATNYEITGEFLTRTVCHIVNAPPGQPVAAPKIVVDSYNIEPGN